MAALFILDVATDLATGRVTLCLRDEGGRALEDEHAVTLAAHRPALWEGLFDLRRHVRRMANVEAPEAQLATLGRFLGEHVLGGGIARRLAEGRISGRCWCGCRIRRTTIWRRRSRGCRGRSRGRRGMR